MIRIARLTDYAMVLVTYMARKPPETVYTSTDLAEAIHVPGPTVSKVLKSLTQAGVLTSTRGVNGGYALARSPDEVTLAEIITALEGPIAITLCSEGPGACDLEAGCVVGANWKRINHAIQSALENISLADMAKPLDPDLVAVVPGGAASDPLTPASDGRPTR